MVSKKVNQKEQRLSEEDLGEVINKTTKGWFKPDEKRRVIIFAELLEDRIKRFLYKKGEGLSKEEFTKFIKEEGEKVKKMVREGYPKDNEVGWEAPSYIG